MRPQRATSWAGLSCAALLAGLPRPTPAPGPAAGRHDSERFPRVVVLGIDGLDPEILREAIERFPERMQNFARLAQQNGIHSLATSTPPQSPVAWASFITGLGPGGHGIFDFIHRDPVTRAPAPGTTRIEPADPIGLWAGWQLPRGGGGESNRSGEAFWSLLADHGVPADVWRMPANFPVEPAKGVSFSGMMTPALDSAYGECTLYTTDPPADAGLGGARIVALTEYDGRIDTRLSGPPNAFRTEEPAVGVPLTIHVDREAQAVALDVDGTVIVLQPGQWSDFVRVSFGLLPLSAYDISGVVRFYLRRIEPELELYASPVNIEPLDPVTPVAAPSSASAELADRSRGGIGIYYTQGMPEDVNALKHEVLDDGEFMAQSKLVHEEGLRMLDWALDRYLARPEGGFLFFYFSGLDLCSHMMWRHSDTGHPDHDAALAAQDSSWWSGRKGSTWKDVILDLYLEMDAVVGRLRERIGEEATLIVMSDHGFAPYERKFDLNRWLWEQGYLVLQEGLDPSKDEVHVFSGVDWSKTRAYGMGFNGLYLNLAGREHDDPRTPENESGIVRPGSEAEALLEELSEKLEALRDPQRDGAQVVVRADLAREVYSGDRLPEAPDLVVGYAAGYGNSDEASLGRVGKVVLEDNLGGTFNGSHLMVPEAVFGTLLSSRPVAAGVHGLEDLTVEILDAYGIQPAAAMRGHPVLVRTRR